MLSPHQLASAHDMLPLVVCVLQVLEYAVHVGRPAALADSVLLGTVGVNGSDSFNVPMNTELSNATHLLVFAANGFGTQARWSRRGNQSSVSRQSIAECRIVSSERLALCQRR